MIDKVLCAKPRAALDPASPDVEFVAYGDTSPSVHVSKGVVQLRFHAVPPVTQYASRAIQDTRNVDNEMPRRQFLLVNHHCQGRVSPAHKLVVGPEATLV
eukprot:CAMPEP_0119153612 /NCGR_PEP_ID=MMETSP1310-20130426/49502_1 /TAXON_ID=464262 /ORGANISM="Genus nov. species nov., Strain RCC2339" /LENGTH=99 /DNA_ID=CAMNT_0007146075 /DNA_START=204 /DNA_END=503 /DNA_ORIENTATION=+